MMEDRSYLQAWNANYVRGRANRYPYDGVVSFVMRNFAARDAAARAQTRILDLGCGGGNHVKFLKDEGFLAFGVDGAPEAVALTKRLIDEPDTDRVRVASFMALPFEVDFFHAVIDRQSVGHNRLSDIIAILAELRRVLKPSGLYYGHVFGERSSGFTHGTHLGDGDYHGFTGGGFGSSHLVHAFTPEGIRCLFGGWELISVTRILTEDALTDEVSTEIYEILAKRP